MADFPFNRLPQDIVRIVLEEAAISSRRILLSIIFLSRAVHQWMKPILYREVILPTLASFFQFYATIRHRDDDAFFARTVRSFTAPERVGEEDMTKILSSCINISSLSIVLPYWVDTLEEIANTRHLTSLKYFTLTDRIRHNILTNIQIEECIRNTAGIFQDILRIHPSVTHLQFNIGLSAFKLLYQSDLFSALWVHTTTFCPNLRVFVILVVPDHITQSLPAKRSEAEILETERSVGRLREEETRIVIINGECEDFKGVKNVLEMNFYKDDIWEKAEEYLKQRTHIQG